MARSISRTTVNFWLDVLLLLLFLTLCWCSVILHFIFPPGPDARGWVLWGWTYVQWTSFQFGVLATLALAVLIHVTLHWNWICGVIATRLRRKGKPPVRDNGSRTLYGVGTMIVVFNAIGLAIAVAALTIQKPPL